MLRIHPVTCHAHPERSVAWAHPSFTHTLPNRAYTPSRSPQLRLKQTAAPHRRPMHVVPGRNLTRAQMGSLPTARYAAERSIAVKTVALANALARKLQHNLLTVDPLSKPDASPVTVADFAVQALIVSRLNSAFPGDRFIAEESTKALRADSNLLSAVADAADLPEDEVLRVIDLCEHNGGDGARTWILDPIDGTRGFIAMRQYCIALGLIEGGLSKVGVLGCPNLPLAGMEVREGDELGCVFHAEEGEGTWMLSEKEIDVAEPIKVLPPALGGKRCTVDDVAIPSDALFCESVERGHSSHEVSARVAEILGVRAPPVRMDSQAKYGCMARGDASIFLRFPKGGYVENIWDSAPAAIVIEEAGGRVTDGRGRPLNFSLGRKLDNEDGIVATNGLVHDKVINAVQEAMREERERGQLLHAQAIVPIDGFMRVLRQCWGACIRG